MNRGKKWNNRTDSEKKKHKRTKKKQRKGRKEFRLKKGRIGKPANQTKNKNKKTTKQKSKEKYNIRDKQIKRK